MTAVEAKKMSVDLLLVEAKLVYYVTEFEKHQSFRPFGLLTNGLEIHFVDTMIASKREVFGFFIRKGLERLLYICLNAKSFSPIETKNKIVDHSYQHKAIRQMGKALTVMATGTGKRCTIMGSMTVFMRFNQARIARFSNNREIV